MIGKQHGDIFLTKLIKITVTKEITRKIIFKTCVDVIYIWKRNAISPYLMINFTHNYNYKLIGFVIVYLKSTEIDYSILLSNL